MSRFIGFAHMHILDKFNHLGPHFALSQARLRSKLSLFYKKKTILRGPECTSRRISAIELLAIH